MRAKKPELNAKKTIASPKLEKPPKEDSRPLYIAIVILIVLLLGLLVAMASFLF